MKIFFLPFFFLFFLLFFNNISFAKSIIGKAKVIDGDTLHIDNNKIRLHAIDAPEKNQTCLVNSKKWFCGKQSTEELKNIINNQIVECLVNDIDRYNRYIAICSSNKINLNQWMVKNGWAIAYRYYSNDYIIEEKYAEDNKLGIWKSEFIEPYAYRRQNKN
tara:strand:+ start:7533 stop:8015 length:483 start_codon:yes stop_codon:yes gene_type:complete